MSVVKTEQLVADGSAEPRTRARVLETVLEQGPVTAAAIARDLGLTPAAVRRHLDALVASGEITAREPAALASQGRGRGRPAKAYTVSKAGRSALPHHYDDIAVAALRHLEDTVGPGAIADFARGRVAEAEGRYASALAGVTDDDRVEALAKALTADGYATTVTPVARGVQLCQHSCPVEQVAAEFPELCEAETEAIGRLLGRHVQRLATLAHGDGLCTTHVPSQMPTPRGKDRS